jgi:hypothetical protein
MLFNNCIGLQDRDALNGEVFDANVLTCMDEPLNAGESIVVGGRVYRYDGDDNLGGSRFTALQPFPEFETVERHFRDNLFVVLEVYRRKNGTFGIWPYVQMGSTSSDSVVREHFGFLGEFTTREAAVEAGWAAGRERIKGFY